MASMSETDTVEMLASHAAPRPALEGMSAPVRVEFAALSDIGKLRSNNEDHFLVARFDRSMQTMLSNLPEGLVPDRAGETTYGMLVADGMGGHAAGEFASRKAIGALVELVLQTPDWIMRLNDEMRVKVAERIGERFRSVNSTIAELAKRDRNLKGMGTTLTLACSFGKDMFIAHIGDSRVYMFRQGKLHRLTSDHNYAQTMVNSGNLTESAAGRHPMRHMLTKAIGIHGEDIRADIDQLELFDGDRVLLCTDGLTEMVNDAAIADVLEHSESAEQACGTLVDKALEAGGKDNITVVVARYWIPKSTSS